MRKANLTRLVTRILSFGVQIFRFNVSAGLKHRRLYIQRRSETTWQMLSEIWDEKLQHVACNIAASVWIIKVWSKRYDIDIMSETFESLCLGSPAIKYVR